RPARRGPCAVVAPAAPPERRAIKRPRTCKGPRPLSALGLGSARAVAACVEAGDHGAVIVGGVAGLLRPAGRIEPGLVHRPAVALVAIVLRLLAALPVARVDVHVRGRAAGRAGG